MQQITTEKQLESMFLRSRETPVVILKHSTACASSAAAKSTVANLASKTSGVAFGILHVIEDRAVSNTLAAITGVRHESPQVIVLRHDKVQWHASHRAVTEEALGQAISALA
jgi:bacillithiol system protein YtxJ